MLNETNRGNKVVAIRLPEADYNKILKLVTKGKYLNPSDFVRKTVSDRLEKL
jgi:Arc/MetJ-type ribon-helix-helix transcriptional regulator